MALDRGRLAKIDRKVFADLDHTDSVQAVKVPVSDGVWSTWRRYCESMGLSMGEGVAGLILDELETVVERRPQPFRSLCRTAIATDSGKRRSARHPREGTGHARRDTEEEGGAPSRVGPSTAHAATGRQPRSRRGKGGSERPGVRAARASSTSIVTGWVGVRVSRRHDRLQRHDRDLGVRSSEGVDQRRARGPGPRFMPSN